MGSHRSYRQHKYDFGKLLLTLRTRVSLTQSEFARQLGVHRRSVQNWETGESYPKADALQRMIALFLRYDAFGKGTEREEAQALWRMVVEDGQQALPAFDELWFARMLANPLENHAAETTQLAPTTDAEAALARQRSPSPNAKAAPTIIDWGEITAISTIYGRDAEIETLRQWIVDDRCRVVTILGLGGIGKSALSITFARQIAGDFDVVLFRSLQNGPPLAQVLDQTIRAVSGQQALLPELLADKIALLVQLFRERRCLLILDNFETILQPGTLTGSYRTGYAEYGALLQGLGEREHQSCLLLTSREKPAELGPLEGRTTPVRVLRLSGLGDNACQTILAVKDIMATSIELAALARLYGGNPLALNLVSEPIRELFGGDVGAFLATGDAFFNGMSKLLDQQFLRSSLLEQSILYWLAVERELVPIDTLIANMGESVHQRDTLSALESLRRRMMIERSPDRPAFTLQPVILEHTTEQLMRIVFQEIVDGQPNLLPKYALIKATAKEYIRRSQEQLIARPLLEQLVANSGSEQIAQQRLSNLLAFWRGLPNLEQGYGPGNIANLLRLLRGNLNGMDFSNLALRHVYLQGVAAHDANLAGSHLIQSVFQEPYAGIESVTCSPDMRIMAVGTVNGEIRLWEVASRTTLLAVKAHTGPVVGLALSRDGQLLASGSADGTIRLWDVADGKNSAILEGHTSVVWTVAISADRRLLVSGSGDGTVRLWNIEDLQAGAKCVAILEGHTSAVRSIALSLDGHLLASGSFDGTVRLWHLPATLSATSASPPCLAILTGHTDAIRSVAISADGRIVASGSVDQSVRLWDTSRISQGITSRLLEEGIAVDEPTPTCIAILTGHTDVIRSVMLSADGRLLATGSGDRSIRLWDIALSGSLLQSGGNCFAILEGHTNAVMSMAMVADGQLLVSGSTDGTVRLWEVRSGICLAMMEGHTNAVMSVALTADEHMLASGGTDGKVRLWDVESSMHIATLQGHTNMAMGVAFSGDGRLLVSGSGDGTVRLWDVADLQNPAPQNANLRNSTFQNASLPNAGKCLTILEAHTNVVRSIAFSADGRLLASGSYDGTIRLWDIDRGILLYTLAGHTNMVVSVALSHDGHLLASGSFDETVRLWDTSTVLAGDGESPKCVAVFRDHSAVVYGVSLSATGQWLASCSFDRTVRLWDTAAILKPTNLKVARSNTAQDQPLSVVISEGYGREPWSVSLSADGQRLAAGNTDGTLCLWDVESRKNLADLEAHSSAIWSVALSADGRLLVSGSGDGTVRVWNGATTTILRAARPYERMEIGGLTGITEAQRLSLIALGAIEQDKSR